MNSVALPRGALGTEESVESQTLRDPFRKLAPEPKMNRESISGLFGHQPFIRASGVRSRIMLLVTPIISSRK